MLWGDWRVCTFETLFLPLAKGVFRKPTFNSLFDPFGSPCRGQKPSLPLRKAPPLTPALFNGLYTPFGSPVCGGQKPQGREDVTALQCYICPTCPSPGGGSLTHSQALALSKRARDVTALLGAQNRYAIRLAGHQSPRQVLRDGTAWLTKRVLVINRSIRLTFYKQVLLPYPFLLSKP